MNLDVLLSDIQSLVGMELQPINSSSDPITLIELDVSQNKYYIRIPTGGRKISRKIDEIIHIWNDLREFGYCNVEHVLSGSGSSRNHPETLFANLPYIEFFKFKNKKHLLFNNAPTHPFGEIKEVSSGDLRKVRTCLLHRENMRLSRVLDNLRDVNAHLLDSFEQLTKKYPGEIKHNKAIAGLDLLTETVNGLSQVFFDRKNINDQSNAEPTDIDVIEQYIEDSQREQQESRDNTSGDDNDSEPSFDREELKIRQIVLSASLIYDRIEYNEIELQPEFQQRERLWKQKEKSLLIESILLDLPIPMFYFAEKENNIWLIVDGLQRTTTIYDFMKGEFKLTDLKFFKNPKDGVQGKLFHELPRQYQRKIREYQIQGHLISVKKDNFEMVRELFQRINTYGVSLSAQEIRCALYPGSAIPFIRYLAESPSFIKATDSKVNSLRMKDMEYVLFVVSHILFGYEDYSYNKEDDFIINTIGKLNGYKFKLIGKFSNDQNNKKLPVWSNDNCDDIFFIIKEKVERGFDLSMKIFAEKRFKKPNSDVLNKQLFVMVSSVLALLPENVVISLIERKEIFTDCFEKLISGQLEPIVKWSTISFEDKDYEYSISQSTSKKTTVLFRFSNFIALIKDVTKIEFDIKGILNDK